MKNISFLSILISAFILVGCASNQGGATEELKTSSDQTDIQKRAGIRLQLAVGYYEQRQFPVALDEIKQALLADVNFADAYGVRALIYMEMGETRLAEDNFLRAISLAPNNPDFSNNYGWFLCQNGRENQSIIQFEAALKNRAYQSPEKALNNAGVCSLKMKNLDAALRYFTESFRYDPGNMATNTNLARIYYERRDYQRARFYVDRVIKANMLSADVLWLAIKIEHKLGDKIIEVSLGTQLRRRHPGSPEYAAYQREAFDE